MKLKLKRSEIQVLQILRMGEIAFVQIAARVGGSVGAVLNSLQRQGLATSRRDEQSTLWSLTEAGREACPPRNPASRSTRRSVPAAALCAPRRQPWGKRLILTEEGWL
jgi:DNA-binding MarR family transcriptional regulator